MRKKWGTPQGSYQEHKNEMQPKNLRYLCDLSTLILHILGPWLLCVGASGS